MTLSMGTEPSDRPRRFPYGQLMNAGPTGQAESPSARAAPSAAHWESVLCFEPCKKGQFFLPQSPLEKVLAVRQQANPFALVQMRRAIADQHRNAQNNVWLAEYLKHREQG